VCCATLDPLQSSPAFPPDHVVALIDALAVLAKTHPQWAAMVQHRDYGGLTIDQTVRLLGIGEKTVRHWWERARLLLHDEIMQRLAAEDVESCKP